MKTSHHSAPVLKDLSKLDDLLKADPLLIPNLNSAPPTPTPTNTSGANRRITFQLQRPARAVKIVGDFTHWDEAPVDMIPVDEGEWFAIVQLPPGEYAYRFIVDGQWCEDPLASRRAPNGFGSQNSVIVVR